MTRPRLASLAAVTALLLQAGCGSAHESAVPRPASAITLPEGTPIVVRTTLRLSTRTARAGQSFTANLDQPLVLDGREIVGRGAVVAGSVLESEHAGRLKGWAILAVQMTRLHIPDGRVVEISTNTIAHAANTRWRRNALKIGVGSGAAGGAVLVTMGDAAVIPNESLLRFALASSVIVAEPRQ